MNRMRRMNLNRGGRVQRFAEGGAVAANTPAVDTGLAQGGGAAQSIQNYFNPSQNWSSGGNYQPIANDFASGIGQGAVGAYQPVRDWQPPATQQQAPLSNNTNTGGGGGGGGGGSSTGYVTPAGGNNNYNSDVQTGGSSGFGFGSTGGIDVNATGNDGAWFNIPSFGQEGAREDVSNAEHGFTTDDVNQSYQDLSVSNPELLPGQFTAGGDQATQHAGLDANQANYSNILQNQEALGLSNADVAALNPAYNAEAQAAHADNQVGVGTWGPGGIIGTTKRADNLLTSDFDNVQGAGYAPLSSAAGSGTSNNDRWSAQNQHQAKQYGLAGASAAAAGISNIGGKSNQGGDNYGLPNEYMVVGSSDGSSEVWGPDGTTYGSVEEAQAAAGGGAAGNAQAQQRIADLQAFSAQTADRGQLAGKAAASTKQANAYVNEQAKLNAGATPEQQAANQQDQLLGDFLWKYEGADTPQMKASYAAKAKAAGLDFGGQDPSDFVTSDAVAGKDKAKLKADARAAKTAADQGIKAVDGGLWSAKTTADSAKGTDVLWSGQTRAETQAANLANVDLTHESASSQRKDAADQAARISGAQAVGVDQGAAQAQLQSGVPAAQVQAETAAAQESAWSDASSLSGSEAKAWLNEQGLGNYAKEDARDAISSLKHDAGFNMGGPISLNYGGQVNPEEELMAQIAQSKVQDVPLQNNKTPLQPGQVKSGGSPLLGIGKKLLGAAIGGPLGGLLNEGGEVPMNFLNQGGWLSNLFGGGQPEPAKKRSRPLPKGYTPSGSKIYEGKAQGGSGLAWADGRNDSNTTRGTDTRLSAVSNAANEKNSSAWGNIKNAFGFNTGGMAPMMGPLSNPMGYNAGGMAQETPIKKVMDEDKIAMAREAFEMAEGRKDEKFGLDEARAAEKHAMDMKMKKQASVTKKAPLAG